MPKHCETKQKKASPNGRAKVQASPNSGATGSECKSQVPYAFPFEASPNRRAKGDDSTNGGAEGVSFAPAGGLYTSVSTNSSAFFHPRSEFDAFAAALPAAGGLVALGGMSAFVGEESADWRDG